MASGRVLKLAKTSMINIYKAFSFWLTPVAFGMSLYELTSYNVYGIK